VWREALERPARISSIAVLYVGRARDSEEAIGVGDSSALIDGLPLLCIALVAVSRQGSLALSRLRILDKGALLVVEFAQHAERATRLDLAPALSTTASITRPLAASPKGGETGGGLDGIDQFVGRMASGGRSDGYISGDRRVDGKGGHYCRLKMQPRAARVVWLGGVEGWRMGG
jgi:hypothetical protein